MLIDYEYRNKKLIISYIDDYGNIKLKYYPWTNPTKFIICDDDDKEKSGKFVTWNGQSVKEIYGYPNRYSIYDFLGQLPEDEKKEIFDYKEPNIFFIDIENEILDKKPDAKSAEGMIQTLSVVNKDKCLVLGLKNLSKSQIESIKNGINNHFGDKIKTNYQFMYKKYDSEYDMILNFFKVMIPKMSVLTGWNFVHYDWTYLINRARILGIDPTITSFTGVLRESWLDTDDSELPAHRVIIDYMELYEKWDTSVKVKESSSLDFVSDNVLGVKKINYEGNLKYLYENDFVKFVMYNAIDSALVQQIHEKMRYIDVLYAVSTLSKIKVLDGFNTLPVTEGILREKMRDEKNVVFVKDDRKGDSGSNDMMIKGGWVKDPIIGLNTWTCCYDFASLYPKSMQEFNISADSYKGQIIKDRGKDIYYMINKLRSGEQVYSSFNGNKIELEKNDIITLNGAVFKNEDGVVKQVMSNIYNERKKYKKMMMTANEELKEYERELEKLEKEMN